MIGDADLLELTRGELIAEAVKLRKGIRRHRDALLDPGSLAKLCSLLPEASEEEELTQEIDAAVLKGLLEEAKT